MRRAIIDKLPSDVDPDTTKADLEGLIDEAQALLNARNLEEATDAVDVLFVDAK